MMKAESRQRTIRNLVLFAVLANGLGWLGKLLGGSPAEPGVGFLLWGAAPLLACVLLRLFAGDGWSDLGIRPRFGVNVPWYVLSVLAYPVMMLSVVVVGVALGWATLSGFSVGAFVASIGMALVPYLLFAILEEFGWRGYLVPRLGTLGLNFMLAHVIVGVIWASWHLPFITEISHHTSESLAVFIPRFYLGCIAGAIMYGEVRAITGSVWPAVLMHWAGNAVANPLMSGFANLIPGREPLSSPGIDGLLILVASAAIGLALHRWRTSRT